MSLMYCCELCFPTIVIKQLTFQTDGMNIVIQNGTQMISFNDLFKVYALHVLLQ